MPSDTFQKKTTDTEKKIGSYFIEAEIRWQFNSKLYVQLLNNRFYSKLG